MVRIAVRAGVFVLAMGYAAIAVAQPSAPDPAGAAPTLKERLRQPDQAGGLHFSEHFAVVFGGIKQGSGIALGPAVSQKFSNGGFAQLKAAYSVKQFKLVQLRYDTPRFWSDRAIVISRARWQDAPTLPLYGLGIESVRSRAEFGERKTEGSSRAIVKLAPFVTVTTGFGLERYATTRGELVPHEDERLSEIPPMPGLGTSPWFGHAFVSAAFDSRVAPEYRRGRLLEGALHDFHDWHDGVDSFRRVEVTAEQLIPTHDERGVIDLGARLWLSQAGPDRSVPFFLMPTLGGGDLLRAFPSYRFRDRNALLLKGEYRWAVHPMVDVAGLYEGGTVAATVKRLSLDSLAHSLGVGLRVHWSASGLLHADLAHGREGFGFRIGITAGE
jgi:hypothetical protein